MKIFVRVFIRVLIINHGCLKSMKMFVSLLKKLLGRIRLEY